MDSELIYDSVVIGGGPAGMTSAIYLARAGKKVLLLEGGAFGGQIALTTRVENYPGAGSIDGPKLSEQMLEDVKRTTVEIIKENCIKLELEGDIKEVITESQIFKTKTIILAMGVRPRQINAELENKFKGKGLCYSATADGEYFKDKDVAIIGGGKSAFVDAFHMLNIAKSVKLIHRTDKFRVSDNELEEAKDKGIEVIPFNIIRQLNGEDKLDSVTLVNTQTGDETNYKIDGIFISAGRVPNTEIVAGVIDTDESGYIVSEDCKTNMEGVFVAGDIRTKSLRQIVTATSDGAIAAILAIAAIKR